MRDLFFTAAMAPVLAAILFYGPHVGIVAWHVLSLMNPHRWAWGFASTMPWAMMVALCTLASWAAHSTPKRFPPTRTVALLLLLVLWVTVTTLTARNPELAVEYWVRAVKIVFMAALTIPIMNNPRGLTLLMWAAAISLGVYGVKGALFTLATGGVWRVQGPIGSFITDNNNLALALVMTIPILLYLARMAERRWQRLLCLAAVPLTTVATVFTYSRGGFVGLVVVYGLLALRSRYRLTFLAAATLLALAALPLVPEQLIERMGSIKSYEEDPSATSRLAMWGMAWRIALDSPLVGGGFKVFIDPAAFARYFPESDRVLDVHSTYFQMLGEHGFVGLGLFLALGLSLFADCLWVIRRTRRRADLDWARLMASMLMISLAGYAVSGTFLTLAFYDYLYLDAAMIVILRSVVARQLAAPPITAATAAPARRGWRGSYWPAPRRPQS